MYNSALNTFTLLCKNQQHLISDFNTPWVETPHELTSQSYIPFPNVFAPTWQASCLHASIFQIYPFQQYSFYFLLDFATFYLLLIEHLKYLGFVLSLLVPLFLSRTWKWEFGVREERSRNMCCREVKHSRQCEENHIMKTPNMERLISKKIIIKKKPSTFKNMCFTPRRINLVGLQSAQALHFVMPRVTLNHQ